MGKIKSISEQGLLAFERQGVRNAADRSVMIHYFDLDGILRSEKFAHSAAEVAETYSRYVDEISEVNRGVYLTNQGLLNADALVTKAKMFEGNILIYDSTIKHLLLNEVQNMQGQRGAKVVLSAKAQIVLSVSKRRTKALKARAVQRAGMRVEPTRNWVAKILKSLL